MVRLYHGTSSANAASIFNSGLRPGNGAEGSLEDHGRLGSAVYMTDNPSVAEAIALFRATQVPGSGALVCTVEAELGNIKDAGHAADAQWQSQGYHSCRSVHPAWVHGGSFTEIAVADARRLRLVAATILGGTTHGDLNAPTDLYLDGNVTISGNINGHTVTIGSKGY